MDHLLPGAILLGAYLIGAIPFGWLIARARGVDIFAEGSGNIGATNVGRILGRKLGILVFVLDFVKGAGPVAAALLAKQWMTVPFWREGWLEVGAGLAAFLGHLFPIYIRFRGGKGVATGAGVVTVLVPVGALVGLLAWLVVISATRYVSLASIVAVIVLCVQQLAATGGNTSDPRSAFCLLAAMLIVARHRTNLGRLWRGTENRLKESPLMSRLPRILHVLALGLWFGMTVFFTFVATPSVFDTFEKVAVSKERPAWFPLPAEFAKVDGDVNGPKEQGSRAAGQVVGPMFPWYYLLQGVCGLIALTTSLAWVKQGKANRWRTGLLVVALATVLAGWPVEQIVTDLRPTRNQTMDTYLQAGSDEAARARTAMLEARQNFGRWHLVSLLLNFATIVTLTGAMALAAALPPEPGVK